MSVRVLTAAAAAIVAGVLLSVFFLVPASSSTEGIALTYYADQDAARVDAGDAMTHVTEDDLVDVPKIQHMLDLARGQSFPHNVDGSGIWGAEPGYRIESSNLEDDDIHVMADLSSLDRTWYDGWISTNAGHGYFEYEGDVFFLGYWKTSY